MQPTNIADPTMTISNFAVIIALDSIEPAALRNPAAVSVSRCGGRRSWQYAGCGFLSRARPFLDHIKDAGYEKDSNRAGSEHSADHRRSHDLAGHRARPARRPQRNAAEDKRERGHQDRAQPEPRPFQSRFRQWSSVFVLILRELDDQNRV